MYEKRNNVNTLILQKKKQMIFPVCKLLTHIGGVVYKKKVIFHVDEVALFKATGQFSLVCVINDAGRRAGAFTIENNFCAYLTKDTLRLHGELHRSTFCINCEPCKQNFLIFQTFHHNV